MLIKQCKHIDKANVHIFGLWSDRQACFVTKPYPNGHFGHGFTNTFVLEF